MQQLAAYDVLIVGAGHAGASTAVALRQTGFTGSIGMVSADPDLPYERPPLSKDYLSGEKEFAQLLFRPASFWDDREIGLHLDDEVTTISAEAHRVATLRGRDISYGKLVWAAGGNTRRLTCSGKDLAGVHSLRSRKDADALLSELAEVTTAVIIGGGYIGLEAAAALVKHGKSVVLLEAQERILARVAAEPLSRFVENEHRARGVDIRLGTQVDCILGGERVRGVRLHDGSEIGCEMVLVGIGIDPAVEPLRAAGAEVANGVVVDERCRTSLPDVFAIGDCALHPNRFSSIGPVRLESVQNATDQANVVAKVIAGGDAVYDAVPWFWSNQYDLRLQTVGLASGHDQVVVRGEPATRSFSVAYLRDKRVIALDCVNATKDYVQGRKLILSKTAVDAAQLASPENRLADLIPA